MATRRLVQRPRPVRRPGARAGCGPRGGRVHRREQQQRAVVRRRRALAADDAGAHAVGDGVGPRHVDAGERLARARFLCRASRRRTASRSAFMPRLPASPADPAALHLVVAQRRQRVRAARRPPCPAGAAPWAGPRWYGPARPAAPRAGGSRPAARARPVAWACGGTAPRPAARPPRSGRTGGRASPRSVILRQSSARPRL